MNNEDLLRKMTVLDLALGQFRAGNPAKEGRWEALADAFGDLTLHCGHREDVQEKVMSTLKSLTRFPYKLRVLGLITHIAQNADGAAHLKRVEPLSHADLTNLMLLELQLAEHYRGIWKDEDMAANTTSSYLEILRNSSSREMNLLAEDLLQTHPIRPVVPMPPRLG